MSRRHLEVESLAEFDRHIARTRRLSGWTIQSVDLTDRADVLAEVDPFEAVFLGCRLTEETEESLRRRGALIFPEIPGSPVNAFRPALYTAEELYDRPAYDDTLDARVYAWSRRHHGVPPLADTLICSLHDHAITDALDEIHLDATEVVGLMGGHAMGRDDPAYARAARLAADLTASGRTVLTGGGPGAMEAANLGAWFAHRPEELDQALGLLATVPSFRPSIDDWARVAFEVRRRWPDGADSIGIPTWFYGHEPPNVFATRIAKFFANALREDTLLQRCRGGIIYLTGAAGTVQEIFQATTGNYYAADPEAIAPLILVGRDHWTRHLPAWPLLERLADGRDMAGRIHLVDDLDEVPTLLA